MDLVDKYLGEGKKEYTDDDWVVVAGRKVVKYVKNPKSDKAPNKSFTASNQEIIRVSKAKQMGIIKEISLLATIGSMGRMPGQWGDRLGSFGTVLASALKKAGVDILGIKAIGKFENEITVSYEGKTKKVKLDNNSSAAKVVKKITGK